MTAGVDQHGDGLVRSARLRVGDNLDDAFGFGLLVAVEEGMEADATGGMVGLERLGGLIGHGTRKEILAQGECVAQHTVDPIHDGWMRAEVHRKRKRDGVDGAYPVFPGLEEKPHLRFAKTVDRLHGVAHQEQRPAIIRVPVPDQAGEQAVLTLGGVLELVDEQVRDAIVQAPGQVGG